MTNEELQTFQPGETIFVEAQRLRHIKTGPIESSAVVTFQVVDRHGTEYGSPATATVDPEGEPSDYYGYVTAPEVAGIYRVQASGQYGLGVYKDVLAFMVTENK
jgi:hypothetical protein